VFKRLVHRIQLLHLQRRIEATALAQQTERINRLLDNPNPAPTRWKNAKGRKHLVDVGAL
jgi:hypothetical protein